MKKLLSLALVLLFVLAFAGCASDSAAPSAAPVPSAAAAEAAPAAEAATEAAASAAEVVYQIGYIGAPNDDNYNYNIATRFADKVLAATDGRIEIQQLPNGQLGGERDMIEGMQLGTVDMTVINNSSVSNFFPAYLVYDLPYFFKDAGTAFKVMDSELAKRINEETYANNGIMVLSHGYAGFRHVINNVHPVREVADMQGMKFRVAETPLSLEAFKALGTNSTVMAWGEVITALQQKTVDGMEIPISAIYSEGVYEVITYLSTTNHFLSPIDLMVSQSVWESLDADTQEIFRTAAQEAAVEQRAFMLENEDRMLQAMIDAGVEVNTDVNMAAFQELCVPVWELFRDQIGSDILDEAIELAK